LIRTNYPWPFVIWNLEKGLGLARFHLRLQALADKALVGPSGPKVKKQNPQLWVGTNWNLDFGAWYLERGLGLARFHLRLQASADKALA